VLVFAVICFSFGGMNGSGRRGSSCCSRQLSTHQQGIPSPRWKFDDVIPEPFILETVEEKQVVLSDQDQYEEKELRSADNDINEEEQPTMANE
jgi:hypothetical protein